MKPTRHPVNRQQYDNRLERMLRGTTMKIPVIAASESWQLLRAYYGSSKRALWFIAWQQFSLWRSDIHSGICLWVSDTMGWTKLYDIPETPDFIAHKQRHGRKCSGSPNCQNDRCIEESVPRWFLILARWHND